MGPKTPKTIAKDAAKALDMAKPIVKLTAKQGAAWDLVQDILERLGK